MSSAAAPSFTGAGAGSGGGVGKCDLCGAPAAARCGRCRGVLYCGPKCQRAAWPTHKSDCAAAVAAAAAVATKAGAATAAGGGGGGTASEVDETAAWVTRVSACSGLGEAGARVAREACAFITAASRPRRAALALGGLPAPLVRLLDAADAEATAIDAATALTRLAETNVGGGRPSRACRDAGALPALLRAIGRWPRAPAAAALTMVTLLLGDPVAQDMAIDAGGVGVLVAALRCADTGEAMSVALALGMLLEGNAGVRARGTAVAAGAIPAVCRLIAAPTPHSVAPEAPPSISVVGATDVLALLASTVPGAADAAVRGGAVASTLALLARRDVARMAHSGAANALSGVVNSSSEGRVAAAAAGAFGILARALAVPDDDEDGTSVALSAARAVKGIAGGPDWELDMDAARVTVAPLVRLLSSRSDAVRAAAAKALNDICYSAPGDGNRAAAVGAGVIEATVPLLSGTLANELGAAARLMANMLLFPAYRARAAAAGAVAPLVALLRCPAADVSRLAVSSLASLAEAGAGAAGEVRGALLARGGAGAAVVRECARGARGADAAAAEAERLRTKAGKLVALCTL